ncbi:MAG: thiamine-monophosphate kinase [Phycisphaerae bacterium]|nr:thiamine-monophosphate kinase [Phycisphaerae bacterium]
MSSGEQDFLEWLRHQDRANGSVPIGIGDDCAGVWVGDRELLITTDMLLDGVHFDSAHHSPEEVGRKAVACSLSDLAAMAARASGAVVAVGLTEGGGIEYAQRMFEGMRALADRFECPIVGGDTTSWSNPAAVCVTMFGECPSGRRPIRRGGAKPGDVIYVSGRLGGSILGHHLTFEPRIELACRLAERCQVHAMMDISDGLAIDLSRICQASGVGAVLDETGLLAATSEAARELSRADGAEPLQHVLNDGEDFELLVTMGDEAFGEEGAEGLIRVGRIVESGLCLCRQDGTELPLRPGGYEHRL